MPKSHPPYAPEFRRQMVELVRSGRTPEALSREFEPTAQAIWNWVRQADRDEGRRPDHPLAVVGRLRAGWRRLLYVRRRDHNRRRGASPNVSFPPDPAVCWPDVER